LAALAAPTVPLDQHLLAERLAQLGGKRPRESVGAATGWEGVENDDGFGGPGLRLSAQPGQRQHAGGHTSEYDPLQLLHERTSSNKRR
jgi:hypothetical protein